MKILVDMGNSVLKWATVSEGVLSQVKSTGYDNFQEQLKSSWQSLSRPELIMVSCVAHEQQWDEFCQLSQALWSITPERLVSPAKGEGVVNAYQQPDNLGSDRWAVLVAAHALYRKDLCIVDCGTAMTIDLLSANGQHLGGVIVPGAQMMQNSLQANTAVISKSTPQPKDNDVQQYWGRDTQSGIITGSWQALAGSTPGRPSPRGPSGAGEW